MDAKAIKENLEYLNDFLHTIGLLDDKTIEEHFTRMAKIVFASVIQRLESEIGSKKDKKPLPEMKSLEDFYNYYGSYLDKSVIDKMIEGQTYEIVSGYLKAMGKQLPK